MTLKNRFKVAINNECGSLILEQIVLIGVLLIICLFLLALIFRFQELNEVKAGYSTTTGWFRTENTEGIKNK